MTDEEVSDAVALVGCSSARESERPVHVPIALIYLNLEFGNLSCVTHQLDWDLWAFSVDSVIIQFSHSFSFGEITMVLGVAVLVSACVPFINYELYFRFFC